MKRCPACYYLASVERIARAVTFVHAPSVAANAFVAGLVCGLEAAPVVADFCPRHREQVRNALATHREIGEREAAADVARERAS